MDVYKTMAKETNAGLCNFNGLTCITIEIGKYTHYINVLFFRRRYFTVNTKHSNSQLLNILDIRNPFKIYMVLPKADSLALDNT